MKQTNSQPKTEIKTLEITNFTGNLTRVKNGTLNSGLAKFDTSWGYNPFAKPGQLTWFKAPASSGLTLNGCVLSSVSRIESGTLQTYCITSTGHLIKVTGEGASQTDLATLSAGSPTFTYGASIQFYGVTNTLYIGHDLGVTKILTTGSGETQVGTWDSTHFTPITTRRALIPFNGLLYATNSDASVTYANNIAEIASGGTVNSYAKLSPSLPVGTYIRDLDVTPDFTYMLISSSLIPSELIAPVNDGGNTGAGGSAVYKWNGTDIGVTTGTALPAFGITANQSFGNSQMMFMYDTFGSSLYDGTKKKLTMRNQKSPFPDATSSTGNFVTWTCPDVYLNLDTNTYTKYGSLYYYGSLDDGSIGNNGAIGLWRMFRQSSLLSNGVIYQMPWQTFTTNRYVSNDTTPTISEDSNGTHLYSFIDYSGSGGSTTNNFFKFYISPPDASTGMTNGVYETQNQLFSKKISTSEVRIYCEPTVANNSFQLDFIGSDGKIVTNGTFTYTFASGTDITKAQGALDRINFNTGMKDLYSLGLRITNLGSVNMAISKIEIDYEESGK